MVVIISKFHFCGRNLRSTIRNSNKNILTRPLFLDFIVEIVEIQRKIAAFLSENRILKLELLAASAVSVNAKKINELQSVRNIAGASRFDRICQHYIVQI